MKKTKPQHDGIYGVQLLQWLRTTTPTFLADETAQRLADGVEEEALWDACLLTANRHLNNRLRDESGWTSQALIGTHIAHSLAVGQEDPIRSKLLLQSLHQTVSDLHNPYFSPYELLPFWPHLEHDVEETIVLLHRSLQVGNAMGADHCFMGLADKLPQADLLDLLFTISLDRFPEDAHALYLLSTAIESRTWTSWSQRLNQLRWVVRHSSGVPHPNETYQHAMQLMSAYGIERGARCTARQPEFIQPMCATLNAAADDGPELVAQAMSGDNIAPQTILAAAVRLACEQVLEGAQHNFANHHAHGTHLHRPLRPRPIHAQPEYTVAKTMDLSLRLSTLHRMLPHMSPANQATAAILAGDLIKKLINHLSTGSSVPQGGPRAHHRYRPYNHRVDCSEHFPFLLTQLRKALFEQNSAMATLTTYAYAHAGGAPQPLIALLVKVAATNSYLSVRMHLEAMLWEFHHANEQNGGEKSSRTSWSFLAQAAYFIAQYAKEMASPSTSQRRCDLREGTKATAEK